MSVLVVASIALPALSHAETPTERLNRELLRQQERERVLRERQEPRPDARISLPEEAAPLRLPLDESPCFPVRRIELVGEEAERFAWAVEAADTPDDPAIGQCLGTGGINLVIRRIQNAIIAEGYITTRLRIEPQDLTSGTLTLTLIPGRIRAVRFAEGTSWRATWQNALPARPGDLLNLRDIEQALENFKRVPTAEVDIQVVPAEGVDARPGESDLVIAWQQAFPFRLTLSADDSGSEYTGKYQGSATLSADHLLTLNDLFYFSYSRDLDRNSGEHGTRGRSIHYSIPFGYWLLGFTGSQYDYYQTVAGINQDYRYSGESENGTLELSRIVQRDAVSKTHLSLAGWVRASRNFIDDTEVEVQRRRMAGWELGVEHQHYFGAASLNAQATWRHGIGTFHNLPAPEEATGEGTSRPRYLTSRVNLNLPFELGGLRLRYQGEWRGQLNDTPLVPQDRFSIGGRYSVRGFDGENTLAGDRGWLLRNDLGVALWDTGQELYVGVDEGEVGGRSSENLIGTRLAGAVLGLRGGYKGFSYDLFAGAPLEKPNGFETAHCAAGFNLNWTF